MFFSSGVRCMIVMGLQESELSTSGGILSEQERSQLEQFIEDANREYYKQQNTGGMVAMDEAEELSESESSEVRPFSKIGQSLLDLAARQKQDIYQAVSLAREHLMISCSSAKPSGGILTPATAFKRLSKVVSDMNPSNVSGGLMNTDIRPFAPAFALETLAVKLRDTKDSKDGFLHGTGTEDILWQNALGSLYRSDTWHEKTTGVLNGLHVAVTTTGITPDHASRLYQSRGMTISRVETFGSCPWRHLLQYGLDLFPTATYVFERNEQGTFNHDVIKMFLDEAMKLPEWPDITEHQQNVLLNRILRERVRQWEGGILRSDIVHRYQGVSIIHGVRTSIASLMRSFQQKPHFLPMAAEVPFGMPDPRSPINLPPISIKTADGAVIAFSGRIDRIDRLELPDGRTYFMIVDNKMSSRDVKQNSIVAGLQLQLPLYIRAAQNGLAGYEAAGGLYQPIKDVLVDGDDAGKIIAQIDKDLQTSGIILDDKGIQDAMKPVKIARKSDTNDTISAVTPEELESVLDCAQDVVTGRVNRIRSGETAPLPLQDGLQSPCSWCDHADACLYDSTLPGCKIRELDHKHRMEMPERKS
jgi:ATP-dependent helicase/nuclease subunit B